MNYDIDKLKEEFRNKCGYEPSQKELFNYMKDKMALENPGKKQQKMGFQGWLIIIWFLCSFAALFYLSGFERTIELMLIFGHYFLVFGIMIVLSNKGVKNLAWLFIAGLIFIGVVVFYPEVITIKINEDKLMFIVMGGIFAGAGILVYPLTTGSLGDREEYQSVQAIVSGYVKGRKRMVACTYEYEFNGMKYNNCDNYYTNVSVPELGSIVHLRVNPEDPNIFVVKRKKTIGDFIFSAIFVVVGLIMIIAGLFV